MFVGVAQGFTGVALVLDLEGSLDYRCDFVGCSLEFHRISLESLWLVIWNARWIIVAISLDVRWGFIGSHWSLFGS